MTEEKWEKVLWKQQPFPDNYVPKGLFLSSLRRNPNFRPYSYWPLVFLSCAITQHLASVAIFVSAFTMLKDRILDPRVLLWVSITGFFLGYLAWEISTHAVSERARRREDRMRAVKASILLFLALMCLAPVLRTLTAATSSDSIWAMAAGLFILNALLADYTPMPGHARERLTSVLSTNAAISSSVVLASRLAHDLAVFALTLFAVEVFALFPMLRRRLQTSPAPLQAGLTMALVLFALGLSARVSTVAPWLYAAIFAFVTFAAPAMLVWAQQYKNEIRGQWDVAVPKVK
ncbi:phosphatidylinositol N-acetylglucosaminyltransferase subunit C [Schizophyllum amplum]|uniref:Phosphatidylinositol N-acetylglucosaminyltransferase subunit C n=1 Tax=Schizophyllum amplum TaxID=97359 RepID=A0A550CNF8_9AGAR|nr:phosphatidylinositol N-acetylglucosaminyltransferase subunit C [Auriculariopsis ampla]